jgi:hypothetical protein
MLGIKNVAYKFYNINFEFLKESGSPGDFSSSVYCLLIVQTEICRLSIFYKEKGLNRQNGLAHLCLFIGDINEHIC